MVDYQCKNRYSWEDFVEIIRLLRAPGGCPWDIEQTHQSIRRDFLEETYEALAALDREDIPAMGLPSSVYVDRQGTDDIYSSLSIAQSDNGYVVEMEIYRLGYFSGTAVEADGMLVYTDDLTDMKCTIRYDSDHAVFEVTESASDLAEAGTTWAFPEKQEGF